MTSFPWVLGSESDDHPSGCPGSCPAQLHLTTRALVTLESARIPMSIITAALRAEAARHAVAAHRAYPSAPGRRWTPRVTSTLESLGVSTAAIERARDLVERRTEARGERGQAHADDKKAKIAAWKAQNKERVAAHSRAYRARMRVVK